MFLVTRNNELGVGQTIAFFMLMNDRLLSSLGPYTMYQRSSDALCVQRFLPGPSGEWGGRFHPPQPIRGLGERRKLPQRSPGPQRPKTNLVHSGAVRKPLVAIILSIPPCMFCTRLIFLLYRPKPIHCNYQFVHYSGFCRISPSILNRFQPNLQA